MKKPVRRPTPFFRKKGFWWPVGIGLGLIFVILLAFRVSPWPGALLIRTVFTDDSIKVKQALAAHESSVPITSITNQQYRQNDPDAYLDVYFPRDIEQTTKTLPVIVWTHGGAWISGSKDDAAPYYKLLAAKGYVVVALDYTLAPSKTYPTQLYQLNDAHEYIEHHAKRFHVDTNNVVLAGDSAGSQLSSQMAALITNVDYADEVGIATALEPSQLKGVVLNCGIYKMEGLTHPLPTVPKLVGWGSDVSVWAYSGTRDISAPVLRQMSTYYHVTKEFPPTYITGGNADPLTDAQSKPFAKKLQSLGIDMTTLFYSAGHSPALPHEYQFDLDNTDGRRALERTVDFVREHTK